MSAVSLALVALLPAAVSAAPAPARVAQDDSGSPPPDSNPLVAPTALDPCQVVTSDEASALSGATYSAGTESTTQDGGKLCVYGAQTTNVFMVLVAQAPDADTAQAEWAQEQAQVQSVIQNGLPGGVSINLNVTDLTLDGFDQAAIAQGSRPTPAGTINGSACYLLKGPTFVAFSNVLLNNPAPSSDALQSQAQTVLGRLP